MEMDVYLWIITTCAVIIIGFLEGEVIFSVKNTDVSALDLFNFAISVLLIILVVIIAIRELL